MKFSPDALGAFTRIKHAPERATITLPPELFQRLKVGDRIDFEFGSMVYEVVLMTIPGGQVELKRIDGKEPA